jgi:putative hydrolase of HD superfamily
VIDALLEAVRLKSLPRAGWLRVGVSGPESVAGHTWGVALGVLLFLPEDLDRERALTYAMVHDLAEVRTGDITPHDGVAPVDKAAAEHEAMVGLCATLPRGDALLNAWLDYEAQVDAESRFVRELDRLDMAIQAVAYADGVDRTEFLDSAARVIQHPVLMRVLGELRARHSSLQAP